MTNLRPIRLLTSLAALAVVALGSARAGVVVADFDDLSLAPNSANQGPLGDPLPPGYSIVDGVYGPVAEGTFTTGGVAFINQRDQSYGSWSGFAYSNETDTTTTGFTNQFSVYSGAALSGSNFGVAFGYNDLAGFDPLNIADLQGLPHLTLPEGATIQGMYVTNTTYTALSLMYGDDFAHVMEPGDWYKVTAYGADASGNVLTDASGNALAVDEYLATYTDAGGKWIADQWLYMDLSALAGAQRLYFNMFGTIENAYGLATPGYFAVDDVTYTIGAPAAVPEPASLAMAGAAVLLVGLAARRRSRA